MNWLPRLRLLRGMRATTRTKRPRPFRPLIEPLERRSLLSVVLQGTPATGSNPRAVAVADVNGDGKLDLVAVNRNGNTVSILLGNGNGTFQVKQDFATGPNPYALAVADVNGDGKLDLATANYGSDTVSV